MSKKNEEPEPIRLLRELTQMFEELRKAPKPIKTTKEKKE